MINIILDFLIISKFHVGKSKPTVNTQAIIRLGCDMASALIGLAYFLFVTLLRHHRDIEHLNVRPSWQALKTLCYPGLYTFTESALRNALYLWLVSGIISMGSDYATAWGVFNTIRWGLVMVPVQALEATSLTFVGHSWGEFRKDVGSLNQRPKASWAQLKCEMRPSSKLGLEEGY